MIRLVSPIVVARKHYLERPHEMNSPPRMAGLFGNMVELLTTKTLYSKRNETNISFKIMSLTHLPPLLSQAQ
jgi:hypothetical protein